jgi:RNA polymerase sigma-70 factor (ECF subfamily)
VLTSNGEDAVQSDAELVQQCLTGDELALRAFMQRYQGLVFSLCHRMLRHREDAEDVAQESFLRVFRNLHRWDHERPLKPWLLTIVANRCRTALERRSKLPGQNDLAIDLTAERREHSKHSQDELDLGEELELALSELRHEYRTCFVLFHQDELSYQEISDVLDCPQGTVKTWLHRARAQLVRLLRERGVVIDGGHGSDDESETGTDSRAAVSTAGGTKRDVK